MVRVTMQMGRLRRAPRGEKQAMPPVTAMTANVRVTVLHRLPCGSALR
jgi:hypothetical protein